MGASGWVHIEVEKIVRETPKAFLCRIKDVWDVWIPKSQISEPENYEEGDEDCTISITEFIAKEKDLEGY